LLPVYGWLGTAGGLPGAFVILLPAAVLAGAGLAISNALADVERDAATGTDSVATRLGVGRAWAVQAILLAVVVGAAWLTLPAGGSAEGAISGAAPGVGALIATAVIGVGIALGRSAAAARRERAWELEAIGVGLLAAAWLAGVPLG
jgi:4-hydroxybenzoate polyprenyltransferase